MNPAESATFEDRYDSLLAAYDEALAAGVRLSLDSATPLPAEAEDLQRDLACVRLLRQVLPRGGADSRAAEESADLACPPELPWKNVGRFQIRRELGHGAFGIVFLAHDPQLGRDVALKIPRMDALTDPDLRKRFQREARAAAALDHPNLVPIYEAGEVGPVCYIASAYCPGITLAHWLKERDQPVAVRAAAALAAQLADGVAHAHAHNVVHRDLKPGNVLLSAKSPADEPSSQEAATVQRAPSDELGFLPRVTDFGLAKLFAADEELGRTRTGAVIGTPGYMAPEQAGGRSADIGPAADVYALGVILYELLTGRPPFQAETAVDTLLLARTTEPVRPSRLRPRLPRDLETICLKCLAKEPHKRYAGAAQLAADLRAFLAGQPIQARPISAVERALKWARRRPAIAALAAMIFLISVIGFAGVTWQWLRAERSADELDINLYFKNVALAEREWSVNNMHRAEQLLLACPPERRGWEWHYVMHLRHGNPPPFRGHAGVVHTVAYSADNRLIASGSEDGSVKVWDANTGACLHTFSELGSPVRSVAFYPDSRRLAAAAGKWVSGGAGRIIVWDVTTGARLFAIDRPEPVRGMAVSGDGKYLASIDWDWASPTGTLQIRDATDGKEARTIVTPRYVNGLAFSPDGRRIALSTGSLVSNHAGAVTLWATNSGAELLTVQHPGGACYGVAFSPDGKLLASGGGPFRGDECDVQVWDASSGRPVHSLRGHAGSLVGVAFSPDSRRLATAGRDKMIKIWDMTSGVEALTLHGHADTVWGLSFSGDGHRLASSSADQTVRIWDATPLQQVGRGAARAVLQGHAGRVNGATFSPDGCWIASAGSDRTVRIWNAKTGEQFHALSGHDGVVVSVAFSPDSRLLASASEDGTARIWDVRAGRQLYTFHKHSNVVESVSISADGRVASVGWDRWLKIWDPSNGQELLVRREAHDWKIEGVAFSPDGRFVATAGSDCTVKVWNSRSDGPPVFETARQNGRLLSVAFSPDGRRLVFSGLSHTAKVYDLDTKEESVTFDKHTDQVNCVTFSPNGERIASASHDATIRIWDAGTGSEIAVLRGHTRWVNSVAFSPDGALLVSAGADGKVMMWDAPAFRRAK